MNEGELNRKISERNIWWRNPEWEKDDPDLMKAKDIPLSYDPRTLESITIGNVYLLRGPRRVGKSVEIKKEISRLIIAGVDPRRIIHFACDTLTKNEFEKLLYVGRDISTQSVIEPRYWFLDEVTSISGNWSGVIKNCRDNTKLGEDCVVLTGSSTAQLREAQKDLAGRKGAAAKDTERLLLPMSFGQFCKAIRIDIPQVSLIEAKNLLSDEAKKVAQELHAWIASLTSAWEIYLMVGGFPLAVNDQRKFGEVQEGFIDTLTDIIEGEVLRKGAKFSQGQMEVLMRKLMKSLSNPLHLASQTLLDELNVKAHGTVQARVDDLQNSYLLWKNYQSQDDEFMLPNLSATPKHYFIDPLIARLAYLRRPAVGAPSSSVLSEQQLGITLLRQRELKRPGSFIRTDTLMHYRTDTRKEIDFVSQWMGGVAIEGKYVDQKWKQEALTIRCKIKSNVLTGGIFATRGILEIDDTVAAVPAPILALMLEGVN
jgi:predicted AAA+ superfamily ATPase